jgi:3-polyprenyl-4-hydroxybenzoate decarboxylase
MMHLSIVQTRLTLRSVFNVFLFERFNIRKYVLWYWQEDGGSLLTNSFMTIAKQRHKVPKLAKSGF